MVTVEDLETAIPILRDLYNIRYNLYVNKLFTARLSLLQTLSTRNVSGTWFSNHLSPIIELIMDDDIRAQTIGKGTEIGSKSLKLLTTLPQSCPD